MSTCVHFAYTPITDDIFVHGVVPYPLAEGEACPSDAMVLFSQAEAQQLQESMRGPFNLSVEDGVIVSGAIATLWGLAWAIKAVRRAL